MSNDEKFIELREKISKDMEPMMSDAEAACWDFYTNSTEENMNKMNVAQDKSTEFFDNAEIYAELKEINKSGGVKDKKLQKQPLCFLMTKIMIIILFVKILAKKKEKTIEII